MKIKKNTTSNEQHGSVNDMNSKNCSSENHELVEIHHIDNTPFTVIKTNENWYVTMGKYRLTQAMETREEAEENAQRMDWDRLIQVMTIVTFNTNKLEKWEQ